MKRNRSIFLTTGVLLLLLGLATLEYNGVIWHNSLFAGAYEVRGLDVSRYQGRIEWDKALGGGEFAFVYIKATEGSDYKDEFFEANWNGAKGEGVLTGAYHFFTTQSPGERQAMHFIDTVPNVPDNLPPVIDIEIGPEHDPEEIGRQLTVMSGMLESHYGKRPMLYVTYETYNRYIADGFKGYDVWIRDIVMHPRLGDGRDWTLWQYNNRGRVRGIRAYVDINAFNGTREQFHAKFVEAETGA